MSTNVSKTKVNNDSNSSCISGSSSSLMKKTKNQLVEIIFRKDAVEKTQQDDYNELNKSYKKICAENDKLTKEVSHVRAENDKLTGIINNLNNQHNNDKVQSIKYSNQNKELNKTCNDLRSELDENASVIAELKQKCNRWKESCITCAAISIILIIVIALTKII
ncbi:MAG: hypothetical protein J6Y28_01685 [Acholeplasmatales bacterium]|nr:hypothetical protein [Methanobrevibacter sp.]MBP5444858.1 hypothetical protein [Acholeplasmatales bacterium]